MKTQFIFSRLGMRATVYRGGDMHTKQQSGFTLVELAVVVFLVGLLAAVGLEALTARVASASISATKKKQETIKDALISYLGRYKRLPCPDTDVTSPDGIENRATTGTQTTPANTTLGCNRNFGIVPYQTLGLPKSAALDGWGNFFSYQVSNNPGPPPNLDWTLTNSFHVGNEGGVTVGDRSGAGVTITNNVAVVISYGKNGLGAYTSKGTRNLPPDLNTDEYQNTQLLTISSPPTFYNREYTDNPNALGGAFDDIVMALNPSDLITPLVKDGALKSAESQWADQLANIRNAVIGSMFSPSSPNLCTPPTQAQFANLLTAIGIPNQFAVNTTFADPWGNTVSYTPNTATIHSAGTYNPAVFSTPLYMLTNVVNPPTYSIVVSSYSTLLVNCPP